MNNLNIILLTYDNLPATKKCIENIYKFTKNFNLIIIDNGSKNDTIIFLRELEKKYDNIVIEFNKENKGIIKGRNQGIDIANKRLTTYEYLFIIDNDQICLENWQESYFKLFEDERVGIVGAEAWKTRPLDHYPYKRIKEKGEEFNYCGCGGMMIRKKLIEKIGGFDADTFHFIYYEDPDFCFRAFRAGYDIKWNHNPVIYHQKHNLRLKRERKRYFMDNWRKFREKWKGFKMPVFKA